MNIKIKEHLSSLYKSWAGEENTAIVRLNAHGSNRQYFRISGPVKSAIGTFNEDARENHAFLSMSYHFSKNGLNVPEIYSEDLKNNIYLQQDLGDQTLFSFLTDERARSGFSEKVIEVYTKAVRALPLFQVKASKDFDYSVCYPRHSFDKQSMMWDLNYFKYYFLKLANIPFDEQKLEDDFETFTNYLLQSSQDYFLYRDFQSRNIMIHNDELYFIDYQGGRKGALQYDLASLLYDAKADIPPDIRNVLLQEYLSRLDKIISVEHSSFMNYYHGYVFIRIMQALGAYGFRGFYERKAHFLQSVPFAIQNLERMLHTAELPIQIPALTDAWSRLVRSSFLRTLNSTQLSLTVRIDSFSYKNGIPWDEKGHGGGFVFDCRSLPNPGRLEEYRILTGKDQAVIDFLISKPEVDSFLKNVFVLVENAVANYQNRNFTDLMVAFGCTGGQHRSVYCANRLAEHLKKKYNVDIKLHHRELV